MRFHAISGALAALLLLVAVQSASSAPASPIASASSGKLSLAPGQPPTIPDVARDKVICFALYTVEKGVLKLSAQFYPLPDNEVGEGDSVKIITGVSAIAEKGDSLILEVMFDRTPKLLSHSRSEQMPRPALIEQT